LALVIIACLAGALVWQYRQEEIDQNLQDISALQLEISSFDNQRSAIEAEQRIEDAKFQNIAINFDSEQGSEDSATVRVPTEWTTKPTQFPGSEVVIGDENVTFRIISSESRNTTAQYIPVVDYIWKIDGNGTNITVLSQSLNCERFDTLGNDLSDEQREHQGFVVYCDESSERVVIAALAAPSGYGVGNNNDYFIIEIEDAQQVSFKAIKNYLESYSL